ncbi:pilus assembly protein Flp/PilA [Novosphingobium kunmingense]|uniref:Pilus assembly protein Flp/PilA n=1 Tax=Novosphingobium kunmingense TaxID=1211806 RepID=A0A2N0H6E0_9SPHN|nr:Flp family type IVb pilin [Novosphingobium kunmingense]PKB14513.1 pilus assembly protein Flp/PilA [Novosphingobium kunmingense]
MTKFVRDFVRDETGAAAAEYALILAIVGAGIATAAFFLGGQVSKAMTGAGSKVCEVPSTSGATLC